MNDRSNARYVEPDVVESFDEAEVLGDTPAIGSHIPLTSLIHREQV